MRTLESAAREPYIAPSWSWASVHEEVYYFRGFSKGEFPSLVSLESIETTVVDPPFGQVEEGGYISINGYAMDVEISCGKGIGSKACVDYDGDGKVS